MSLATMELVRRFFLPFLFVVVMAAGLYAIHEHGFDSGNAKANAEWQRKWDKHVRADADITRQAESTARAEEQRRQQSINKVVQDGQQQIDQARADADAAAATAGSLRDAIDRTVSQLADSQARVSACTTAASQAAARHARVLADVLKLADQAAGSMAANADQSRARGLICEQAYDGVKGFE